MFSVLFWKRTAERAIKSAAQDIGKVMLLAGTGSLVFDLDWRVMLGAAATGAIFSIVTSIGSAPFGEGESPSLVTPSTADKAARVEAAIEGVADAEAEQTAAEADH